MANTVTIHVDVNKRFIRASGALYLGEQAPIAFRIVGSTIPSGHSVRMTVFADVDGKKVPVADNSTNAGILDLRAQALVDAFAGCMHEKVFSCSLVDVDSSGAFSGDVIAYDEIPICWSPVVFDPVTGTPATMMGPKGDSGNDGTDGSDGEDGVGISDVSDVGLDDGGNRIVRITLTDGTNYDIHVPKGPKGDDGEVSSAQLASAVGVERERAQAAEALLQPKIAKYVTNATVSGGKLTLQISDGTSIQFTGGSGSVAWSSITGKPETFTPSEHQHTKSQISDFPTSMTPNSHASSHATGGEDAITPEDIGAFSSSGGEITGDVNLADISGLGGGRRKITVYGSKGNVSIEGGYAQFKPKVVIGGVNAATVDQIPYQISAVIDGVLQDRTVNTSSTGGTFTFPAKVGTESRDFSLVIPEQDTAPSISFPTEGVTYVSEQSASELWSAEANAVNEWYFHENGANQFAVFHRAFAPVTQAS